MHINSNRYIFSYIAPPDEVEDFIRRSDDLASQTYGRDKAFSRLNQVLEQARFLGWPLPRFGPNIPEELTDIPLSGINHIFENQAKLLVDVAPFTRVMLEDGRYCPVRMVCGATAAGDLVWRCHLLNDDKGSPYVQRSGTRYKVKTKGTKLVCQTESLVYDAEYLVECFGGGEGLWPVPFLPEFFSDQPIALTFRPEEGLVEVVRIQETDPVHVFAKDIVPWYRPIEINRTKSLTFDEELPNLEDNNQPHQTHLPQPQTHQSMEYLVEGWDTMPNNETFDIDEVDEEVDYVDEDIEDMDEDGLCVFINVATSLTDTEYKKLQSYDSLLDNNSISSKEEAENLLKDPEHKDRAESWLVAAVNRVRLLANHSEKLGALISIVEKNRDHQLLLIQPRQKWATKVVELLNQRDIDAQLYDPKDRNQLSAFLSGTLKVIVTAKPREELFIEGLTIISVSSFTPIPWLDILTDTNMVYSIITKQLGYSDYNLVSEHNNLSAEMEPYEGPGVDVLKLEEDYINKSVAKPATKDKLKKQVKSKFKIVVMDKGQKKGRPKSAATYEKALVVAKKLEEKGQTCEIFAPDVLLDSKNPLYITGMPTQLQGDLN